MEIIDAERMIDRRSEVGSDALEKAKYFSVMTMMRHASMSETVLVDRSRQRIAT
ncbi:MAG: hypothetical protein WAT74_00800 [Flavobacteriales bacterium]